MKKIYATLCIVIASLTQLQAQAPQGFNYQAQVRNSAGDLIVNTNVYFKFNVMQGSQTALPIFTEIHYVPTDDLAQVNLIIGQGTATTGVFSELDWSVGSYFLGIELDTGNGYTAMGTSQLLSVPFAMYAENSGSSSGYPIGGVEGEVLTIVNGVPTWTNTSEYINSESLAEITTVLATNIDFESMIAGGNILNDGGFTIISKGVVWSEFPDPTPELETKTDEGGGASSFTSSVIGLDDETEYFYRAYATTSSGTAYGSTYTFVTDSSQIYDQDEDGYTPEQGDCNDSDASIFPGAAEILDGIDNNCDGSVDENLCGNGILESGEACDDGGLNDPASNCYECQLYIDADNDGFNAYFDCNDYDAFTYPGAAENNSTTACMTDADGDGFGDIAGATPGNDCNDSDASTFPGATEIEDGIDNDCDGGVDEDFCLANLVTLDITFDPYPQETAWVMQLNGSTIDSGGISGGAFSGEYAGEDSFSKTWCLEDGNYTFVIYDSYGDGICCTYADGSYSVTLGDGTVLAAGGSFGNNESTPFTL